MTWRVVGVDPSLTGTGLAIVAASGAPRLLTITPGRRRGHDRIAYLRDQVAQRITAGNLVVVEGPAYGAQKGAGHHEMAGLWWHLTHDLWRRGIGWAVVPPATLKRYAAGKGNAAKDQVLSAVIRRYGHLVDVEDNNQADALALAAMGADQLGHAIVGAPAAHRAALAAVTWPPTLIEEPA